MLEVTTHDDLTREDVLRAWSRLVAADAEARVFHAPRFQRVWHTTLGRSTEARVRFVRRDGEVIGCVPEGLERVGSPTGPEVLLRFLGGTEVTDYLGPVARPDDRQDVARAWMRAVADERDWDELELGGLAADLPWYGLLRAEAEEAGLRVLEDVVEDVCPRIRIAGSYDQYLRELPGKLRHELRRKARKLARDGGTVRLAEPGLEEGFEAFLALAQEAEGEKGRFFVDDRMQRFFRALIEEFDDGALRIHLLHVADRPAAATISVVDGREWGLYNSAFDMTLRALAPGMVLVGELIRIAAEEEYRVFDLLRGDEAYKYRFGAVDRTLHRLTITRP